jgi:exopolyphosphatase/guanosine-5'-triphosphate,3'-diphosphate pyrophosphatase
MEARVSGVADPDGESRREAGPPQAAHGTAFAALDLGSNNCRLLIARPIEGGFHVIDAFSRIVRLGEGMGSGGGTPVLSQPAQRRTLKALGVCAAKMHRRGVRVGRCVATEACRRADNATGFVRRVHRQTGIALEVISCGEEAELVVAGCAPLFEADTAHALIFDIGGGSTELIWVRLGAGGVRRILGAWSVPCGVLNLAERHGGDRYTRDDYEAMVGHVSSLIAPFAARHRIGETVVQGRVQMIGTSGTVTTLAGIEMGLAGYDRARVDGVSLGFDALARVSHDLATMGYNARAGHPCVGRERADLVVGGCAVLEAICRAWPVGRLTVADRGVREGILYDLIAADRRRGEAAGAGPAASEH